MKKRALSELRKVTLSNFLHCCSISLFHQTFRNP
uniref:Uncharacterized protein n=1 Tax=Arundo donax TaxID=35708 RepID=A0A0A9HQZ1_ARUDO